MAKESQRPSSLSEVYESVLADKTAQERIWAKVVKTDSCWNWVSCRNRKGYSIFRVRSPKKKCGYQKLLVHRITYELLIGKIPDGLTIDHLCRNRQCVNPQHLEPVTGKVNTLRGAGLTAINARKTVCSRGHPFNEANTYVYKSEKYLGGRKCKMCIRITARELRNRWRLL